MIRRCHNPKSDSYKRYGDRGIEVCDEWRYSFKSFLQWVEKSGYQKGLTLNRINNDLGYNPENCGWATTKEQQRNTRLNCNITAFGETKTVIEWTEDSRCVVSETTLRSRLKRGKWTPEEAITRERSRGIHLNALRYEAFGESKTIHDWIIDHRCVVSKRTLVSRIQELNWVPEVALTMPPAPRGQKKGLCG